MIPKRGVALLAIFLVVLASACATGGKPSAGKPGQSVAISVNNNLIPPTSLTVYIVSETGSRQLLGNLTPSARQTLSFNPIGASNSYRLVARTTSGADIASTPFTLTRSDATVNWDLRSRIATVNE